MNPGAHSLCQPAPSACGVLRWQITATPAALAAWEATAMQIMKQEVLFQGTVEWKSIWELSQLSNQTIFIIM